MVGLVSCHTSKLDSVTPSTSENSATPDDAAEVGETHAAIGVEESDRYLPPLPTDVALAMSSTTA